MSRPPLARLIRTPRDAEIAARDWLAHFGDTDTRLGPGTADGGVDVESNQSVVQVKAGETPTGRPVIQQTFGVAVVEQKRAMVFSVAPFTGEAVDWADQAGVSLFQLDLTGACAAVNELGQQIFDDADHRLSGWPAVIAELEALRSEGRAGSITSIFKLRNGFQGFFGIWVDAQGNTEAVRDFAGAARRRMANPTEAVEFVAAALRQIGGGYWDCRPVLKVDDDERRFRPRPTYEQPSVPSVVGAGRRPGQPDRPKRIRVTGSDVYKLVAHPSCVRRLFLEAHGEKGDPPTAFGTLLIETGIELERTHLDSLPIVADLSDGSMNERAQQTLAAIDAGEEIIYQGVLSATVRVDGRLIDAVGIPDFLIRSPGGYTIRDTKTAIRISETERPDIVAQLRFYAWLLPRMTGTSADRVEVIAGDGIVHDFPIHGPVSTEDHVRRAIAAKTAHTQPACGVKWSDRGTCPFFQRCWDEAIDRNDLAVVPGVPRSLASELRRRGISTIDDLLHHHSPASLQDVQYRRGSRVVRVGSRADDILRAANALTTRRPIIHGPVDLPSAPTVILFDLEGIPRLGSRYRTDLPVGSETGRSRRTAIPGRVRRPGPERRPGRMDQIPVGGQRSPRPARFRHPVRALGELRTNPAQGLHQGLRRPSRSRPPSTGQPRRPAPNRQRTASPCPSTPTASKRSRNTSDSNAPNQNSEGTGRSPNGKKHSKPHHHNDDKNSCDPSPPTTKKTYSACGPCTGGWPNRHSADPHPQSNPKADRRRESTLEWSRLTAGDLL